MRPEPGTPKPLRSLTAALALALACAIAVGFAVLSGLGWFVAGASAALATIAGGVSGLAVRDSRERAVSVGRSLGDSLRRLVIVLWY